MQVESFYTVDHDSSAGYGGRIGYRYKTVVVTKFDSKCWNKAKKARAIGGFVVDLANALYKLNGFSSSYNPQVDTKARGKKGVTTVTFEYFHNNDLDAERMNYKGRMKSVHQTYVRPSTQAELDVNREQK